jgi:hypothetical protein
VDDDRGREVGVVEDVGMDPVSGRPAQLRVAQGARGQQITLSADDVIDVAPSDRRLVIGSRPEHRAPQATDGSAVTWRPDNMSGAVRSLVARLRGHHPG